MLGAQLTSQKGQGKTTRQVVDTYVSRYPWRLIKTVCSKDSIRVEYSNALGVSHEMYERISHEEPFSDVSGVLLLGMFAFKMMITG